jgi:RIO kinase 1
LDYVKQCEADIFNMSIMQRSSSRYEPTANKLYDQPLLGFVRTKNIHIEKEQEQSAQNIVKVEEDESKSCSSSDEDDSWHEVDPKMVPKERKATQKENKKKVKEEKEAVDSS